MSQRLVFWLFVILAFVLVFAILFALLDLVLWVVLRWFLSWRTIRTVCLAVDGVLLVTLIASVVVGHYHTRFQLDVNRVTLTSPRLPASFDGMRVAHISDFHIDSFDAPADQPFMDRLTAAIKAERPDIICFTGDLVTISSAQARPWCDVLARLASETGAPLYTILGNHDYADYVAAVSDAWRIADRDSLRRLQADAGWQMLDNRTVVLRRGADSVAVVGVGNIGEPPFTTYGDLKKALGTTVDPRHTFTILLSHNPMHWRSEVLPDTDIDLMLAGHTHAMQLRVCGWSPAVLRYKEWGGLYSEGNQHLYVNTGIGCTGPRVRIGVPPELTIITLRSGK